MRAYSMDLRERVLRDSDAGMKAAVVARVAEEGPCSIKNLIRDIPELSETTETCDARGHNT